MVPDLLIFLGILLATLVILQLLLRRKWVRERAEVFTVLDAASDDLAAEHPTQLAARLNRVRRTEAVHVGFSEHETIRECDRESARADVIRAREAAEKIRAAMNACVKNRVEAGVVTPAMAGHGAANSSAAGGEHE